MKKMSATLSRLAILCLTVVACSNSPLPADPPATEQIAANWISHGRTDSEQRYSPLAQITTDNVEQLGVAWATSLDSLRGVEATPLVVDGIMYTTGSWSVVFALDAKTGELLWKHDPQVPRSKAVHACCDVVNRGVAIHQDKVIVGTLDGRLLALNRATGEQIWSTRTFDITLPYTITGAPRIVKDKVIIGNGGAEFGVRGFIAAYNVATGEQVWKFYTVPGNPANGFENSAMKMAAQTWTGQWWKLGGGGTVWDSMAYDPELDLLYFGVGNGSPWNQKVRSPQGGDNLFLSSIVAVRPDSGEYVWHYQTTPGETWDYTATQSIILADLEQGGHRRKVLLQAPKNGFFYVIDRETGEFISAQNFVPVNWASHIDPATGRPVELASARYPQDAVMITPGPFAAHNWHPMSYNPALGLAYIPAQEAPFVYHDLIEGDLARLDKDGMNTGVELSTADLPATQAERDSLVKQLTRGHLAAWDPVAQKEVWRVQYDRMWNGGTLTSAGNLVFQGGADQSFAAYDARTGDKLWSQAINAVMLGGPISYEVDGEQYIAASAGWGSILHMFGGYVSGQKGAPQSGHMVAFKLGGDANFRLQDTPVPAISKPPAETALASSIEHGRKAYNRFCIVCHGESVVSSGSTPDLRYSASLGTDAFYAFVLEGISQNGMPNFQGRLSLQETEDIHAYIVNRAWLAYRDENQAAGL